MFVNLKQSSYICGRMEKITQISGVFNCDYLWLVKSDFLYLTSGKRVLEYLYMRKIFSLSWRYKIFCPQIVHHRSRMLQTSCIS